MLQNVQRMGSYLKVQLNDWLICLYAIVGDISGRGVFVNIEFGKNRTTKVPFSAEGNVGGHSKRIWGQEIAVYRIFNGVSDDSNDHFLIAPAFNINTEKISVTSLEIAAELYCEVVLLHIGV